MKAMKVSDVIAHLRERDQDAPVYVWDGAPEKFLPVDCVSFEAGGHGDSPAARSLPAGAIVIWGTM